ncbi:choice-of-anchor L domain-containing protein [Chloracidobacterium thermophilum]|uniref:choice-of-anchor L domain-containing protein n=1 Tax=Chloracidobacterium thermophilum TaxID=458033 RepID=UPI0012FF4C4B|nr:choice-of-anchor L domain-containing protein [Chloracidobacterium thermophilum]
MKRLCGCLIGLWFGLWLFSPTATAQTTVIPETNANTLAGAIMGPGYTITSATVTTATPVPTGRFVSPNFTVTSPPNINMAAGIVLATSGVTGSGGEEEEPPIPVTQGRRRGDRTGGIGRLSLGLPGDPVIDAITGGTSFDAVSLTVTFIPTTTRTFNLRFVFATNESVPAGTFNDAAAILISGPDITETNLALLPEDVPTTVNNLDGSAAHIPDAFLDAGYANITTPLLTQPVTLTAGETYTLRIVVADVGDSIVSSAIFVAPGQELVNNRVNLVITGSALDASAPCSGYATDLVLTGVLTNLTSSPVVLSNVFLQVAVLGAPASGSAFAFTEVSPNPHRLRTADQATCSSGGQASSIQSVDLSSQSPANFLEPGDSQTVTFRIALPTTARFRFYVNVYANEDPTPTSGPSWRAQTDTPRRLEPIEVDLSRFLDRRPASGRPMPAAPAGNPASTSRR